MGSLLLAEEPCRKDNQGEDYEVDETRLLTVQERSNLPRLRERTAMLLPRLLGDAHTCSARRITAQLEKDWGVCLFCHGRLIIRGGRFRRILGVITELQDWRVGFSSGLVSYGHE
jgi:hypothetical protein